MRYVSCKPSNLFSMTYLANITFVCTEHIFSVTLQVTEINGYKLVKRILYANFKDKNNFIKPEKQESGRIKTGRFVILLKKSKKQI